MDFFSPCLISLSKTFKIVLHKNGESFLFQIIEEKLSSSLPLSMILVVVLSYTAFIMLYSFHTRFTESLYHEWMLTYIKCLFAIYWDNSGPLEKGMANHFGIFAMRILWTVWKGKKIGHWKMNSAGL